MNTRHVIAISALALSLAGSAASAANYTVDWLQMGPTFFGSPPPYSGTYFLPGVGNVQVTYNADPDFTEARLAVPQLVTGSVTSGGDTYSWTNAECLARTNWAFSGNLNTSWSVTYTFPGTLPAGSIVLDVQGLGRRDPDVVGAPPAAFMSTATVNQNGTYFGDFTGAMNVGPTQFTSSAGQFQMINSLTGPGGQDPWWNTGMGIVRIDDAVNSLTVHFDQTAGDGVGVNIGVITPAPGSAALLGFGALAAIRRRR